MSNGDPGWYTRSYHQSPMGEVHLSCSLCMCSNSILCECKCHETSKASPSWLKGCQYCRMVYEASAGHTCSPHIEAELIKDEGRLDRLEKVVEALGLEVDRLQWTKLEPIKIMPRKKHAGIYKQVKGKLHIKATLPSRRNWSSIIFWSIVIGLAVFNFGVFGMIYMGV